MACFTEGILAQGKARRASILDEYVGDEQRSLGAKAPGKIGQLLLQENRNVTFFVFHVSVFKPFFSERFLIFWPTGWPEFAVEDAADSVIDEDEEDTTGATALKPIMVGAIQLRQIA